MGTAVCGRDSPAHADEQLHPMLNARNGHKAHAPKAHALSPLTGITGGNSLVNRGGYEPSDHHDSMHFSAPKPSVASQTTRAHLLNDVLPRRREMRRVAAAPQLEPYFAALRHTRMQSAVAR